MHASYKHLLLIIATVRPTEIKLPGNFCKLSIETHDSILIMARARRNLHRLKEQRAGKRRKDELALQEQMEKASADHAETLFLCEQYA